MTRVETYLRDNRDDLDALCRQRECFEKTVKRQHWSCVGEVIETPESEYFLFEAREGIHTLLADAAEGVFDILLIDKPDDLTNDQEKLDAFLDSIYRNGAKVFCCRGGHWLAPGGRKWPPVPKGCGWYIDPPILTNEQKEQ